MNEDELDTKGEIGQCNALEGQVKNYEDAKILIFTEIMLFCV